MTWHRMLAVVLVASTAAVSSPLAQPRYSAWSAAVNLGSPVNSSFTETGATLSKHGLSLYFSSNRPCDGADAVADFNLWVSRRNTAEALWGEPECLQMNADARISGDSPYQDREPELSRDQHWLYFVSDRPGSMGPPVPVGGDIWVSWRSNIFDDQGWNEPFPLTGINTAARESSPNYFENDDHGLPQLFFSRTQDGLFDIWVADLANGISIADPRRVNEVNTDQLNEAGGSVSHDGLEMFLFRGRGMIGIPFDIYSTTRPDVVSPWSSPFNLGPAVNNAAVNDQEPKISPDRTTLFFASNRPGSMPGPTGAPSIDIWVSARTWGGNGH